MALFYYNADRMNIRRGKENIRPLKVKKSKMKMTILTMILKIAIIICIPGIPVVLTE